MSSSTESAAPVGGPSLPAPGRAAALALTVIVSCEMMLMLDGTIMNTALPVIKQSLGFTPAGLSWVANGFLLAFGGLLLLGGRAGDILGRRRVFVIGIAIFTVASLLGGLATAPWWLITMRVVQGVGAALAGPSTLALLTTNFQGEAQAKAFGVYSAVTASAMTLGLILGGIITTLLSWHWVLLINVPIGLVVGLLAPKYVAESPRHPGRFDTLGAVTSALGVTGIVYGLVRSADHGWGDTVGAVMIPVGVLLLVAFVFVERSAAQPVLPLRIFADRGRAVGFLGMLLVPMVTMSMQFLLVQYLQQVSGFSPLLAGLAFLPMAAGLLVTSQTAVRVLGRIGLKPTAVTGAVLIAAGVAWLTAISADTGYLTGIAGPMLLVGAGLGFVVVPFNITIMSTVDQSEAGAASGGLQTVMMTGASLGIAALSSVYAATVNPGGGVVALPDPVTISDGMRNAFVASLVFAVVVLALVLFVLPSARKAAAGANEAPAAEVDEPSAAVPDNAC